MISSSLMNKGDESLCKLGVFLIRNCRMEDISIHANKDIVTLSHETPGLKSLLEKFYVEHLHEDDEMRYVLEGSGFFDVRNEKDNWLRISIQKGDFVIIPAGIYHRFSLDDNMYIKAMRIFSDAPKWIAHERSFNTDQMDTRVDYKNGLKTNCK
eukprot:NODE_56_length_28873_cov_1.243101.p15 type:complete len:154 gc:universal NODE_56_length_28873_cov_1.243101:27885-27424(-)